MVKILENGYILTEKQNDNINSIIGNLQSKDIEELLNAGYHLTQNNFTHIFNDSKFIELYKLNSNFKEQLNKKLKDDSNFPMQLFTSFSKYIKSVSKLEPKDIIEDYTYETKASNLCVLLVKKMNQINRTVFFMKNYWENIITNENSESIIKNIQKIQNNFKCYSKYLNELYPQKIIKDFQSEIDTFFKEINSYLEKNSSDNLQKLLNDTKEVFLNENIEKTISKLSEDQILSFSIKKLPENIQSLILKIESNCQKLNNSTDVEIQHIVNQTIDKLLPETLKKYSMIDEEYKTTLKNKDGKSAQDLLIESLNNMNARLISIIQKNNETQLLEMEIGATFTKKLRNS